MRVGAGWRHDMWHFPFLTVAGLSWCGAHPMSIKAPASICIHFQQLILHSPLPPGTCRYLTCPHHSLSLRALLCAFLMNLSCRSLAPSTPAPLPSLGFQPWGSSSLRRHLMLSLLFRAYTPLFSLVPLRTGIFPQSAGSALGAVPCPSDEPRGSVCQLLDLSSG